MQWKHMDSQLKRNLELSRQPGTVSVPAYGHAVIFHNYIRSDWIAAMWSRSKPE